VFVLSSGHVQLALDGTGGVAVGGSADVEVIVDAVGSGGVAVGGAATVAFNPLLALAGTGGVLVGGSSDMDVITDAEGSGGVLVGGTADVEVVVNAVGSGGVAVGGAAIIDPPELLLDCTGDLALTVDPSGLIQPTTAREVILPGSRRFTFRHELLDSTNTVVGDLDTVTEATVSQDWLADIKRKLSLTMRDGGTLQVDWLSDRIRPWVRLHLPPYEDGDWVEWPQGVFLLSSPRRHTDEAGTVWRSVDGYDQLQALADDRVVDRYVVPSGTVYTTAVTTLLSGYTAVVRVAASTLPVTREWAPGTSKLRIINDLLGEINYQSLSFDEAGNAVVQPYTAPSQRVEEWRFADDESSLTLPQVDQELDLFGVPNSWVLVVSNPDQSTLTATYTNTDPASPTSTVRRGRTITDFRTETDAADQAALDAKVARLAFEASQIYEHLSFSTGLMPICSGNDVYRIVHGPLAVNAAFCETSWSMPLKAGAAMTRKARRVVSVSGGA
jgi:hypothetical protein